MASPVGHGLLVSGLGVEHVGDGLSVDWRTAAFVVFASVAPDLDMLVGLLIGDINRFHRGASHSLTAALIFGIALIPVVRTVTSRWKHYAILGSLGYGSHLFLDFFTRDGRAPYGQPILWPLSDHYFHGPWTPLGGIKHGVPGQGLGTVLSQIFSWSNLAAIGREIVFVVPILVVVLFFQRRRFNRDPDGISRGGS